jgi:hypothetical protein
MTELSVPRAAHPETPPTQRLLELAGCHLTTPHKLRPEAGLRNLPGEVRLFVP